MRYVMTATLTVALGLLAVGCGSRKFDGPTVDAFTGRVVKDGKPVSFPAGESVELQVILHEKAQQFGIPIAADGSFKIGWMPIGKYSAILKRVKEGAMKGGPNMYNVPGGFEIVDGKTEYEVELGKNWKP
jgi:hypothetical protein